MATKASLPTENEECYALVEYLDILREKGDVLLFSHIPQETFTKNWAVKAKNKRLGVRRGVPDYVIVHKNGVMFIEMKRVKLGKVRKEQREWIDAFNDTGVPAAVCMGFDQAKEFIERQIYVDSAARH